VERYFADFLSVMESKDTLKLYSGSIRKHDTEDIPERIYWPKNLFIIGTVNIDESTYMFSPKVLDRANVIEFRVSKEEMVDYLGEQSPVDMTQLLSGGITLAQGFLGLCQQPTPSNVLKEYQNEMVQIFDVLKTLGAEFGYRSASEIGRLIHSLGNLGVAQKNDKIDIAIMQKMLPKLHGSRTKLHPVLEQLGKICLTDGDKWKDYLEVNAPTEFKEDDNVKYKLSFEKIVRMYKNASANGFASYAEA
jgi:5-methylcytosine-specific restriction protein B